jgi:hypothetical protein
MHLLLQMNNNYTMWTDYEIIQPNYYVMYFDILYHSLPNIADLLIHLHDKFYLNTNFITEEHCEHIQDSIFW